MTCGFRSDISDIRDNIPVSGDSGVNLNTMPPPEIRLRWIPDSVSNLVHNNDIDGRTGLAKATGLSRSTVYLAFAEDWSGYATTTVLATLAHHFGVPLNRLVAEPAAEKRNLRKSGRIAS